MPFVRRGVTATEALMALDAKIKKVLFNAVGDASKSLTEDYTVINRKWRNRGAFFYRLKWESNKLVAVVYIFGTDKAKNVFVWTDFGTKPHWIFPKKARFLAFQKDYSAKTQPIARYNVGSGKSSGAWQRSKGVYHPGTTPRLFSKTYKAKLTQLVIQYIHAELKRI